MTCSHAFSLRTVTRGTQSASRSDWFIFPAGLSLAARVRSKIWLVHLNVSPCHDWSEALLRFCFYDAHLKTALICYHCIILAGVLSQISQMPIVLIPVHFDRDPINHIPSCQRSLVIRTFITNDFMTGVPATPGKHIPIEVSGSDIYESSRSGIFNPVFSLE